MTARIGLSIDESAASIGVSRDHFERHVLPHLRVTVCGRRKIVALKELERYLDERSVGGTMRSTK